jgi:hypothetical protein
MPFLGSKGSVGPNVPCDKPDGAEPCNDCGSPYRADFRKRILQCAVYPPEVTLCPACYAKREAESVYVGMTTKIAHPAKEPGEVDGGYS